MPNLLSNVAEEVSIPIPPPPSYEFLLPPSEDFKVIGLSHYTTRVPEHFGFKFHKREAHIKPHLYLGVELEVRVLNMRGTSSNLAYLISNWAFKNFVVCKADVSTGIGGFEITSTPATFAVHKTVWNKFFKDYAHQCSSKAITLSNIFPKSCGMHVHVSKNWFSTLEIGKLLVFMNSPNNFALITKIAGRSENSWAKPKSGGHKITDNFFDPMYSYNTDRYAMVNTKNVDTLEIRIFDSTTDRHVFMYRLEFVQATCEFIKVAYTNKLTSLEFRKWLSTKANKRRFPNLTTFLKVNKGLQ